MHCLMSFGGQATNWGANWENWGFEIGTGHQNPGNPPAGGKSKGKAPQAAGYYGRGSQWGTGQASPPPQPVTRRNHDNDPSQIIAVQLDQPLRPFVNIPLEPFNIGQRSGTHYSGSASHWQPGNSNQQSVRSIQQPGNSIQSVVNPTQQPGRSIQQTVRSTQQAGNPIQQSVSSTQQLGSAISQFNNPNQQASSSSHRPIHQEEQSDLPSTSETDIEPDSETDWEEEDEQMFAAEESRRRATSRMQSYVAVKQGATAGRGRPQPTQPQGTTQRRRTNADTHVEVQDSEEEIDDQDTMLQRGVSVAVAPDNWASEHYAVRKQFIKDIMMRLNCGTPSVDAFATMKNRRWTQHWGAGNPEHPDAFKEDWSFAKVGLIWANPPFSKLSQVVQKAKHDKVRMILICPEWDRQEWYKEAMSITQRSYRYNAGTPFFELNGRPVAGTRWNVWALYIDTTDEGQGTPWDRMPKRTMSSKRRYRRRKLEEAQE